MLFSELLKFGPSRKNIDQIVELALTDKQAFDELWTLFTTFRGPESRNAAWAIDILNEKHNDLIKKEKLIYLIDNLRRIKHDGHKRHSLRIIDSHDIITERLGELTSICFDWLENNKESVGVKMYCIKILTRISKIEPEIIRELIDLIEIQLDESTPGFKNIGIKTITRLRKTIK